MININEMRQTVKEVCWLTTPFTVDELLELLDRLEAWENVFGHLGTPDEVGNEWHALSDRLEAAEKERDVLSAELSKQQTLTDAAQHIAGVAQRRANQLQAKIAAMKQQEPVAIVDYKRGSCIRWVEYLGWQKIKDGTKLYALPGAKGEEK